MGATESIDKKYNFSGEKGFSITVDQGSVYITVTPIVHGPEILKVEEVIAELNKYPIEITDVSIVEKALKEQSGSPVLIGKEVKEQQSEDGYIKLEVTPNKLQAYVRVFPPKGKGKAIDFELAKQVLVENKVIYGLNEDALTQAINEANPKEKIVVAQGKPAIDGEPAQLIYHFSTDSKVRLSENQDGKVDFYNLGVVKNAHQGQVLVEKIMPGLGEYGYTVGWEKISPKPGKDVPLPMGKNVSICPEGRKLLANNNGQIVFDLSGKVSVFPIYEVNGDLDLSVGNIDFIDSVLVRGNVGSGFTIKAGGYIEVHGSVDASSLTADGDIIIKRGIQGRGKGVLSSKASVKAMFAENCSIHAEEDVIIQEAIMHCTVIASKKVIVEGRRGLLVGGSIKAGDEIIAHEIGANLATQTEIEIGINPHLRTELVELQKKMPTTQDSLVKTKQALDILKQTQKKLGYLPESKQELLVKLTRTQFSLMQEIENIKRRKIELEELITDHQKGKLVVKKTIHPGTKVTIGNASKYVRDEISNAILINEDANIKIIPC